MTIEVITAAIDKDLTTIEAVKDVLGITDTDTDEFFTTLITRASKAAVQFCRREFAKEQVKETIHGTGTARLWLERMPLVSITSVTYEGTAVDADEYAIERHGKGTVLRENKWTLNTYGDDIPKPDWEITYWAGWALPSQLDRDLPEDIEQACIEMVKTWYYARCRDGSLRTEEVVDVWQGTYSGQAIPMAAKQLLNPWRLLHA